MEKKTCIKCEIEKDITDFQFRTDTKKYRNQCKRCRQNKVNEYRRTNEEYKKRYNKYRKERRQTDEHYLIMERFRARIKKALKSKNADKCLKSQELLGCSVKEFKIHIEKQFRDGMSWDKRNFVLDHIIPCSSFDLSKEEEQIKCFNYKNIQPLFWSENSKKSNKLIYIF